MSVEDLLNYLIVPGKPTAASLSDARGPSPSQPLRLGSTTNFQSQKLSPSPRHIGYPKRDFATMSLSPASSYASLPDGLQTSPASAHIARPPFLTSGDLMSATDYDREFGLRNGSSATAAAPQPVPLEMKGSAYVVEFTSLCQTRCVQPEWTYVEVGTAQSPAFGAKVRFAGREVQDLRPSSSKKEAKNRCAAKAIEVLNAMKEDAFGVISSAANAQDLQAENWIGTLLEFCNAQRIVPPEYQIYQSQLSFYCEATLQAVPDQVFGSRSSHPFPSKKLAQKNAAKEAVVWLRENNHMDRADHRKKRKMNTSQPTQSASQATSLNLLEPNATNNLQAALTGSGTHTDENGPLADGPYTSEVISLANILGFNPPTYTIERGDPLSTSIWSAYATFDDLRLSGNIGQVKNVHGKNNARQECARLVLIRLKEIDAERNVMWEKLQSQLKKRS